jgi:hypothetical protein
MIKTVLGFKTNQITKTGEYIDIKMKARDIKENIGINGWIIRRMIFKKNICEDVNKKKFSKVDFNSYKYNFKTTHIILS